jgi:hypothetical protein
MQKVEAAKVSFTTAELSVTNADLAADHLTETERQKCLEMEVTATAERDDEVARHGRPWHNLWVSN